jgi:hypothetical protein
MTGACNSHSCPQLVFFNNDSAQSNEWVVQPTVAADSQRASARCLAQPKVMTVLITLTSLAHLPNGSTNKFPRLCVADLFSTARTLHNTTETCSGLCRLQPQDAIQRAPVACLYQFTACNCKTALFFTKLDLRISCHSLITRAC